jgi:hypothetical protein
MSQEDYMPARAADQYNGADKRTEQLQEELDELEAAQAAALKPTEEPKTADDEFKEAYSEVDIIAHDAKAAAANTRWAQQRFNESKKAREDLEKAEAVNETLRGKLDEATRRQPEVPLEDWADDNPESAAQVDARIHQNNIVQNEAMVKLKEEIVSLKADRTADIEAQIELAAVAALTKRIPDAQTILTSPEFGTWLETKPAMKQIIEGTLDVDSAEQVLQSYKFSLASQSPEELKQQTLQADIEAGAEAVKSSSNQPIENNAPRIWKASEINAMSVPEYQKHEKEIDQAFAEGRFDPTS